MAESVPVTLRNSAKAVIIRDGQVLLERARWRGEISYFLPGGGQKPGEPLHDTVRREVFEETGVTVSVDRLSWVREYIGLRHPAVRVDAGMHRVDFVFSCIPDQIPDQLGGGNQDPSQIGFDWIQLEQVPACPLLPTALRQPIAALATGMPVFGYLGEGG